MGFRITDEGQVMQGKNLRHTGADPGRSVKTLMKDIDVALLRHIPGISFIRQPMDRAHPIEGARRKPKQGVERAPLSSTRRRFGTAFARRHVGHIHPPCGLHMATQVCQISGDPGMNRHKRQGVTARCIFSTKGLHSARWIAARYLCMTPSVLSRYPHCLYR